MIPIKTFREHLINNTNETYADKIMEVVGDTDIVNVKLAGGIMGMATPETIYVDIDRVLDTCKDEMALSFVILHELGHYSRISTLADEWYDDLMLKTTYEEFLEWFRFEEEYADNFAKNKIKEIFNIEYTLMDRDYNTYEFEFMIKVLYNGMRNSVNNRKELIDYLKTYVVNVRQ